MTDWEFVFDGVVGYLKSPIWNYPIVTFIEKNCIVFDPDDENQLRYTEIHIEYSSLVEELLSCYLKDVGITEEQFVRACEAGSNSTSTIADQSIFQHVWAAEDFELFKTLMVTKNIEMEQQAVKMIKQQRGNVPSIISSEKTPTKKKAKSHKKSEDELMREVMRQSQKEYEKEKERNKEIKNMEKTLSLSKEESERILDLAEQELLNMERSVGLSMKLEKHVDKETTSKQSSSKSSEKPSSTKSSSPKGVKKETKSTKDTSKPEKSSSKGDATKHGKAPKDKTESSSSRKSSSSKEPTTARESSKHEKHSSSSKNEKTKESSPPMKTKPKVEEVKKHVESKTPQEKEVPKSPTKTIEKPMLTKEPQKQEKTTAPVKSKEAEKKPSELMTSSEAANSWLASAKAEAAAVTTDSNSSNNKNAWGLTEEEIKEKTARFREQAYRIKHERLAKNLQQYNEQQPTQRPKSSRAAMRQVNKNAGLKSEDTTASPPVKQTKAFSPALIQFLKAQQQQLQQQS